MASCCVLTLSEREVQQLLDLEKLVCALEQAFRRDIHAVVMPTRLQMEAPAGVQLLMPCYDPALPAMGFKSVFVSKDRTPGQHRFQATYFLLNPANGKVLVSIEANYLTDLRTAAISAIASRHMARKNANILAVFGTGRQARAHVQVFASTFHLETILVCGSTPDQSVAFEKEMTRTVSVPVRAANARTCAADAAIICTCTSATSPLFDGRLLNAGAHLNLVGAFRTTDREVDSEAVRRARVVVDTYDGALCEAGELIIPLREEVITRSHIIADLHEIVSGKISGRSSDDDVTLFKSVGCALEDLIAASLVSEAARARAMTKRTGLTR